MERYVQLLRDQVKDSNKNILYFKLIVLVGFSRIIGILEIVIIFIVIFIFTPNKGISFGSRKTTANDTSADGFAFSIDTDVFTFIQTRLYRVLGEACGAKLASLAFEV